MSRTTNCKAFAVGDRVASPSGTAVVRDVQGDRVVIEYENPEIFAGSGWSTVCWEREAVLVRVDAETPVFPERILQK